MELILALRFEGISRGRINELIRAVRTAGVAEPGLCELAYSATVKSWDLAHEEVELASKNSVSILTALDPEYPECLFEIPDPPLVIYLLGSLNTRFPVGIVGARAATSYGKRVAATLSRDLTLRGATVVSGLAYGIDASAHAGAIEACSECSSGEDCLSGVAVLGCGVLCVYPPENQKLWEGLLEFGGGILSEFGLFTKPRPEFFPQRNRIISGLCKAVVIVEAAEKSGALITASFALEQGRDVYVVPGPVDSPKSRGTNKLLQQGASVLLCAEDLGATYPELSGLRSVRSHPVLATEDQSFVRGGALRISEEETLVLKVIEDEGIMDFDQLVKLTNLAPSKVSMILSSLELSGAIKAEGSGNFIIS